MAYLSEKGRFSLMSFGNATEGLARRYAFVRFSGCHFADPVTQSRFLFLPGGIFLYI